MVIKRKNAWDNFLDFIPVHNICYESNIYGNGIVTLIHPNRGIINTLAQLMFGKPEISYIHLDDMGSFIWNNIDGIRTIYDIALALQDRFGDEAEPLYNRLVQYIQMLAGYGFIVYVDNCIS